MEQLRVGAKSKLDEVAAETASHGKALAVMEARLEEDMASALAQQLEKWVRATEESLLQGIGSVRQVLGEATGHGEALTVVRRRLDALSDDLAAEHRGRCEAIAALEGRVGE